MKKRLPKPLLDGLKGITIGIANPIPGVSGGTIAVMTGIYDDLVAAFGTFFKTGWKKNLVFVTPVLVGGVIGVGLFARIIEFLLDAYHEQTIFLFMGLILGSVPYLYRRAGTKAFKRVYVVPFLVMFGLVFWMGLAERPPTGAPITELTVATAALVFLAGGVSAGTMAIPGVSGSFILLLIGMYGTVITAFSDMNVPILAVFVIGALVGMVLVAKGITWLLARFHGPTYYAIIGMVIGSTVTLWPGMTAGWGAVIDVGSFVLGVALSIVLGSGRKEQMLASQRIGAER